MTGEETPRGDLEGDEKKDAWIRGTVYVLCMCSMNPVKVIQLLYSSKKAILDHDTASVVTL